MERFSITWDGELKREAYAILFFIEHKGSNGPPGVGTVTSLATNLDSGAVLGLPQS